METPPTLHNALGAAASLIAAPAIVRPASLMPVRRLPFSFGRQYAGFVERLFFHALESRVRNLKAGETSFIFNNREMAVEDARRRVSHMRKPTALFLLTFASIATEGVYRFEERHLLLYDPMDRNVADFDSSEQMETPFSD